MDIQPWHLFSLILKEASTKQEMENYFLKKYEALPAKKQILQKLTADEMRPMRLSYRRCFIFFLVDSSLRGSFLKKKIFFENVFKLLILFLWN